VRALLHMHDVTPPKDLSLSQTPQNSHLAKLKRHDACRLASWDTTTLYAIATIRRRTNTQH
jgi:hypothetical protein